MQLSVCLSLLLLLLVVGACCFNIDVWDHEGNLLTSTKFDVNNTEWEDPSGSGDFEYGSGGDQGFLLGDCEEEPTEPWQFDECLRKYNNLEPIYPRSIAVPLNFPTRAGKPETSPQDKIYPIVGSTFTLTFPNCSRYQYFFAPLANTSFFPNTHSHITEHHHNSSLTLTIKHITEHTFLMVSVACMDIPIRGRVFHINDPEITYILAIRPNFQDLSWFVQTTAAPGSKDEFHPYINVTYEADASYWFNPEAYWLPINLPLGLPDQPIPFRLSHSLNITMAQCPGHAMLLHTYRPYRSPDGRVQIFPKPQTNDSFYYGFFDVTSGTSGAYMTLCNELPEALSDRYMVFRPNFRDMEFSASTPPFYGVPITVYPNLVLWRHPDWAFVHTTRQEQVFPIDRLSNYTLANVTIPAGLAGWRVQFTMDDLNEVLNLTVGENKLPDGGLLVLNVSYNGQSLAFTLLNITDSYFGQYEVTVMYSDGTSRTGFYQHQFYIRPHLRPSFFNPDVKAPYTHRFPMPWDRRNPEHRAMALQAAMEGVTPEAPSGSSGIGPGMQFFFLVCAVAVLGLSVVVMLLAMRYVRPIIVNTHENPNPRELEEAVWLKRHQEPWNYSSSGSDDISLDSESSV